MLNNKGMTLVEVLLVLGITALLLGLPANALTSFSEALEERLFFNALDANLSHSQTYAIVNNRRTSMEIQPDQKRIRFYANEDTGGSSDYILSFPENMAVKTPRNNYSFNPGSGNISHINTVTFNSKNTTTKYIFQLGSGRYKVEKTHK